VYVVVRIYRVFGDVLGKVDVDDCEAVLNGFGNVGLYRISLGTVSVGAVQDTQ
jgi:hypothetical protein